MSKEEQKLSIIPMAVCSAPNGKKQIIVGTIARRKPRRDDKGSRKRQRPRK